MDMKRKPGFTHLALAVTSLVMVQSCDNKGNTSVPDHDKIMDRTIAMVMKYDEILALDNIKLADNDMMQNLTNDLFSYINQSPRPYKSNLGINMKPDASFLGFDDKNSDNRQDPGEKHMFTMEVDLENQTLIYTDETGAHHGYRMRGSGFFVGAIWGGMNDKQKAAGVKPNRFANAAVNAKDYSGPKHKTTPARTRTASAKKPSRARSKARSGGVRSGK